MVRRSRVARAALTLVLWLTLLPGRADAVGVRSPFPVALRARIDVRLVADEASVPSGNLESRSPADASRAMADARVNHGLAGSFYLKGAASWNDTDDASGRVRARIEQGDWSRVWAGDDTRAQVVVFGDERRFFTGELTAPVMDDETLAQFQHRVGARIDGAVDVVRATVLAAELDEGDRARTLGFAAAGVATRPVSATASLLHQSPDTGDDHAVVKGEAVASWWKTSALVSYRQSGFGNGVFVPGGDWEDGGYAQASPDNSATTAEVRALRMAVGKSAWFDAAWQYSVTGSAFVDDLAPALAGSERHRAWIGASHRRYALDAHLAFHDLVRHDVSSDERRGAELTTRAWLRDNSELVLRGGVSRLRSAGISDTERFLHASYGRSLSRFSGYVHARVDHAGERTFGSAGTEARVNWNATSALVVRCVVSDRDPARSQSLHARLEFRPTRRTWVTAGYGRAQVGAGPYLLDDTSSLPSADTNNVFTLSVRGDL